MQLAREDKKRVESGANPAGRLVKSVLLSTEYIPEEVCSEIHEIWSLQV